MLDLGSFSWIAGRRMGSSRWGFKEEMDLAGFSNRLAKRWVQGGVKSEQEKMVCYSGFFARFGLYSFAFLQDLMGQCDAKSCARSSPVMVSKLNYEEFLASTIDYIPCFC